METLDTAHQPPIIPDAWHDLLSEGGTVIGQYNPRQRRLRIFHREHGRRSITTVDLGKYDRENA